MTKFVFGRGEASVRRNSLRFAGGLARICVLILLILIAGAEAGSAEEPEDGAPFTAFAVYDEGTGVHIMLEPVAGHSYLIGVHPGPYWVKLFDDQKKNLMPSHKMGTVLIPVTETMFRLLPAKEIAGNSYVRIEISPKELQRYFDGEKYNPENFKFVSVSFLCVALDEVLEAQKTGKEIRRQTVTLNMVRFIEHAKQKQMEGKGAVDPSHPDGFGAPKRK